jgi:Tol biopolymer transport system component/DNA-binding winged helix-turn-helix (wHTH) protein
MENAAQPAVLLRFESFEANLAERELRKHGVKLKLHDQPFQVLAMLMARPGELVTRAEIQRQLWPTGTFVDFENGLNSAVNRLRDALGDSADHPTYIETVPRKGYRFLATVARDPIGLNVRAAAGGGARTTVHRPGFQLNRILATTAIALGAIAVAPSAMRGPRGGVPAEQAEELKLRSKPLVTYGDGGQWLPAYSPDGSRIAYAWVGDGGWQLEVKLIGSDSRIRLTKSAAKFPPGPAWSPDGSQIAFARADALEERGIYVTPTLGGPERKLRSLAAWRVPQRMVSWSPDGKWIAFSDEYQPKEGVKSRPRGPNAIYLISPETLETKQLTFPAETDFGDAAPAFSPDGTMIAFVHSTAESHDEIWTINVAGGMPRKVVTEGVWTNGITWTADSRSLIFDRSFGGGFVLRKASLAGGPLQKIDVPDSRGSLLEPTVWHNRLAYEAHEVDDTIARVPLGGPAMASGSPEMPVASTRSEHSGRFSPSGKKMAFLSNRTGADELWVANADGSNLAQLSHLGMPLLDAVWSPDEATIAVSATAGKVYLIAVDTRESREIFSAPAFTDESAITLAFARDGKSIYVVTEPGTGEKYVVLKVPVSGGKASKILEGIITDVEESPDGRTLFYSRAETVSTQVESQLWMRATEGGPEKLVARYADLWDVTSSGIYVIDRGSNVEHYDLTGKRLPNAAKIGPWGIRPPFSVAPDGKSALTGYRKRSTVEIDGAEGVH